MVEERTTLSAGEDERLPADAKATAKREKTISAGQVITPRTRRGTLPALSRVGGIVKPTEMRRGGGRATDAPTVRLTQPPSTTAAATYRTAPALAVGPM